VRVIVVALAVLALVAPTVGAEHPHREESGTLVGNPTTGVADASLAETLAPCQPDGLGEGVDGDWYEIEHFATHDFRLEPAPALDADLWFYTEDCTEIDDDTDGARGLLGETETGDVPYDARYVVVTGFLGAGTYELTLTLK